MGSMGGVYWGCGQHWDGVCSDYIFYQSEDIRLSVYNVMGSRIISYCQDELIHCHMRM